MKKLLNIITPNHESSARDYLERMLDDKTRCAVIAKTYGSDYWDGERRYGYGGHHYINGWWTDVAHQLIQTYNISSGTKVLEVGCGKGYLLYELQQLIPGIEICGFDISSYAIDNAKPEIRDALFIHDAAVKYPFKDLEFDLVLSIGCLHNLPLYQLPMAIQEIERVAQDKFIVVESYRNEEELFHLQCWALTANSFFDPQEWLFLFDEYGYVGDYELIYFV